MTQLDALWVTIAAGFALTCPTVMQVLVLLIGSVITVVVWQFRKLGYLREALGDTPKPS